MFADPAKNLALLAIPPTAVVADFGSGSGAYTLSLAAACRGGRIYAVDVQKDLLARVKEEAIRRHLSNVEVIWGNVEKVGGSKLRDNAVDWVLISNTLFQTPAKYTMLLEAKRVLRPEGRLVIIDWTDSHGGLGPTPTEVVTAAAARQIAESAGFALEKELPAGEHHYGLVFKK